MHYKCCMGNKGGETALRLIGCKAFDTAPDEPELLPVARKKFYGAMEKTTGPEGNRHQFDANQK
jgi:hypothetical protein